MANLKKKIKKSKYKSQKEGTDGKSEREREREKRGVEREKLISKIYGIRTVGFRWSKKKSRSTHRELRVGIKILNFRQTSQGREFSYLGYF